MIYFISLIAMFFIITIITIVVTNFIRFKTISKKAKIGTTLLILLLLIPCTIDLFFFFSGGISKLTDITITDAHSKYTYIYSIAVLKDRDGQIYIASGIPKFQRENRVCINTRIAYLPCTRKVIKIEVKLDSDKLYYYVDMSPDGYVQVYDYSKDTLPVTIAFVGLSLIILLIWLIRMSSNKR